MVCECSGTRGGVAVASCANTGDALASAANRRTLIFMQKFRNDMQGDYRMQMLALEDQTHAGSPKLRGAANQSSAADQKNMRRLNVRIELHVIAATAPGVSRAAQQILHLIRVALHRTEVFNRNVNK